MADTVYTDYSQTVTINAAWLNDINNVVYRLLGTSVGVGGAAPTTVAQLQANLGIATPTNVAASIAAAFASPATLGSTTPGMVNSSGGALNGTLGATTPAAVTATTVTATNGIVGRTTAVPAGAVGERIESVFTGVSMTSGTLTNLTSISLTAGVWDVTAVGDINTSTLTAVSAGANGVSTTSVTLPAAGRYQQFQYGTPTGFGIVAPIVAPSQRLVLGATTTVYYVARATVASGTLTAEGTMSAVRAG